MHDLPMPAPGTGSGEPALSLVHDLLAAIVETLDVPRPHQFRDEDAYHRLLESRAAQLRGYLRAMVDRQDAPDIHADGIRRMTSNNPVTYTAWERPTQQDAGADR
ncbi:hypothetical protein [Streptomyces odonnellii]|uniref:hypothetical protein n=1 Tax=Streptomyces odonnellii TaxID=1417980 RepID=UPI0006254A0A|nr:hypothetical protein [Streptomyces odonnellii]